MRCWLTISLSSDLISVYDPFNTLFQQHGVEVDQQASF
jgi:hypothetical protein